jgi:hypothetical protein
MKDIGKHCWRLLKSDLKDGPREPEQVSHPSAGAGAGAIQSRNWHPNEAL